MGKDERKEAILDSLSEIANLFYKGKTEEIVSKYGTKGMKLLVEVLRTIV